MTSPSPHPLIFTPAHLQLLGLEHDPQRQNEATPYPFAYDRAANESVFFNPVGCMISFRMLERALARAGIEVWTTRDGLEPWIVTARRYDDRHYNYDQRTESDPDLITAYVSAAFALASP